MPDCKPSQESMTGECTNPRGEYTTIIFAKRTWYQGTF